MLQVDAAGAHHDQVGLDLIGHIADHKRWFALPLDQFAFDACFGKGVVRFLQQLRHGIHIPHGAAAFLHHREQHQLAVVLLHQLQHRRRGVHGCAALVEGKQNGAEHGAAKGPAFVLARRGHRSMPRGLKGKLAALPPPTHYGQALLVGTEQ